MKKAVADYEELEAQFVQQMLEDRRRGHAVFKQNSGLWAQTKKEPPAA